MVIVLTGPIYTCWYCLCMVTLLALTSITMQVEGGSSTVTGSCIVSALLQPLHLFQHSALSGPVAEAGLGMLHVGGPHRVWIKRTQQHYYTLTRATWHDAADNDGEVTAAGTVPSGAIWQKHRFTAGSSLQQQSMCTCPCHTDLVLATFSNPCTVRVGHDVVLCI